MTIEQLPSGSFRASMMKNGKRYRVTYDHRPGKREAEQDLYALIARDGNRKNGKMTFKTAADKYVDSKRNVLSPSTIRAYVVMLRNLSPWFMELPIDDVCQLDVNKQINELALAHTPKTVRNNHGLISAILGTFRPDFRLHTTLPQKTKAEPYIPTHEDVKRLLEAFDGTEYYVPIILACYGLRRGEILALTPEDLEGDVVHVTKAAVIDEHGNVVIKAPKTTDSIRDVVIPMRIADLIREKGYVYNGYHNQITDRITEVQKQLGMPHFSLHKLRHYFTTSLAPTTPRKDLMKLGGWSSEYVMNTVYEHSQRDQYEQIMRDACKKIEDFIF